MSLIDWVGEALRTVLVWAFHILGQGCSSQGGGIFLWKAVEKSPQNEGWEGSLRLRSGQAFRLRVPTRFARRHASLEMTMCAIEVKERARRPTPHEQRYDRKNIERRTSSHSQSGLL